MSCEKETQFQADMKAVRSEIDRIDRQVVPLLISRMRCSEQVAKLKQEAGKPVFDPVREQEILSSLRSTDEEYGESLAAIYTGIMSASRAKQHVILARGKEIREMEQTAPQLLERANVRVLCQGKRGAYSERAANILFPDDPNITFEPTFLKIFQGVANEQTDYGILPVENSMAGSVSEVFDLLLKYRCFIVESVVVRINHCIAATDDSQPIKKVISHPQALRQCEEYIRQHGLEAIAFSNTAAAAEAIKEQNEPGAGVICSLDAAKSRGLKIVEENIQNTEHNATRFILIAKRPILPKQADKISLCFSLPHTTGSLYNILESFAIHGLNLTKIESVPIPERQFEYDFYLDFTGNIHDPKTLELICSLHDELTRFSFLGNYMEIIE